MNFVVKFSILAAVIEQALCSAGDHSPYYQKCLEKCKLSDCTEEGDFEEDHKQPLELYLTQWSCVDECRYDCMWKTVDAFHERNWRTPQFYGKWPFIRILGMQEPASVLFSILNGVVHFKMLRKFRRVVRPDSPLVWLWHAFFIVCVHAWFWSAVFHARDFSITELLDYACAFSIVLINCLVMLIRILRDKVPKILLVVIAVFIVAFFINHAAYLSMSQIDYGFNMELNIMIGTFTAICWFGWCIYNRRRQPYVWKCAIFVALTGIVMLLEIIDRPPIFYLIDCHSLWHLSTAPLAALFYSFAIDDCRYLRKKELEPEPLKKAP